LNLEKRLYMFAAIFVGISLFLGLVGYISINIIHGELDDVQAVYDDTVFLEKKLNDHYVWMESLSNQLIMDEEFNKELDPTKCDFGKWYYEYIESDSFNNLPSDIQSLILELEEPHSDLHLHGSEIKELYADIDLSLEAFFVNIKLSHYMWMDDLQNVWRDNDETFAGITDPTQCKYGKWYYSIKGTDYFNQFPKEIRDAFLEVEESHALIHESATEILDMADVNEKIIDPIIKQDAMNLFDTTTRDHAKDLTNSFDVIINYAKAESQKKNDAMEIYSVDVKDAISIINSKIGLYQEYLDSEIEMANTHVNNAMSISTLALIILLIAGAIFGFLIAMKVVKGLVKPIKRIESDMKRVSEGDLTLESINCENKECGELKELSASFNYMVSQFKLLITNILDNSNKVSQSAENLSAMSQEANASSEQVSATIQEIAKGGQVLSVSASDSKQATETLSNSVNNIASTANDSNKEAIETKELAVKGSEAAKDASEKMKVLTETFKSSASKIEELGTKTQEINKIIEVINSISEQTNLLALNAAIEAARAGEAGKGFAVVADEVRKLAEESQKATKQIEEMISEIISSVQNSVEGMQKGTVELEEGNKVISDALNSLNTIGSKVTGLTSQIEMITAATQGQLSLNDKVKKSIDEVSSVAEESAASTEEVSASIEEITGSVQQVSTNAQSLSQNAADLKKLVDKFRL